MRRFGPYLRDGIPTCPVGSRAGLRGVRMICGTALPAFDAEATDAGWVYNSETGLIACNADGRDPGGRLWTGY